MTEMIFWLVLIGGGSSYSQAVVPVPYQTEETCAAAGAKFREQNWFGVYACVPQPRADVELWTEAHADRDGGY